MGPEALAAHLDSQDAVIVLMTFSQIDSVVGRLPASARKHNAWWANSVTAHSHARAWLDAGYLASPEFVEGRVRFTRGAPRPSSGPSRTSRPVTTTPPPTPDLRPTGEAYRGEIAYDWLAAGEITLSNGRLVVPALGVSPGVYRFRLVEPEGDVRSFYVGESENLFQRMNGYRNPGPTQATNQRINLLLCDLLDDGGAVRVSLIHEATLDGVSLDFRRKPARLLVENSALLHLAAQGAVVENLRTA